MQNIEKFYNETVDQVFGYVMIRVRNRALAEDIVSESYLKVMKNFDKFEKRKHASRKSWLFTIVRNTLTDTYRSKKNQNEELSNTLIGSLGSEIENQIDINWQYNKVLEHLDSLSERQREILMLRYKAELRNKEIAKLLGIEEKSVSATLSKATKKLREILIEKAYA